MCGAPLEHSRSILEVVNLPTYSFFWIIIKLYAFQVHKYYIVFGVLGVNDPHGLLLCDEPPGSSHTYKHTVKPQCPSVVSVFPNYHRHHHSDPSFQSVPSCIPDVAIPMAMC